jgi:hypothetical protein
MKIKLLTAVALLAALGSIASLPVRAQEPPANTYNPGFWQPVERYDPSRLTQVRLVNRSGYILLYSLTTDEAVSRRLLPGGTVVLSNIRPDSYIVVYSSDTAAQAGSPVKYNITVSNNVITTTVTRNPIAPGEQTIHLHPNGGIYVY